MKTLQEVKDDVMKQFQDWKSRNCVRIPSSMLGKFATGFGGPGKPNESISQADFKTLTTYWTSLNLMPEAKGCKIPGPASTTTAVNISFRDAGSGSGVAENIQDLLVEVGGNNNYGFIYHIKVVK